MPIDLFTDDLNAVPNNELFAAIADFAKAMPSEGWRHEYTTQWQDSALKDVAAFANTFGGLLIIGAKKDKTDSECQLVGVESEVEYKTRVASSIAANISPNPNCNFGECQHPENSKLRFCVIRVPHSRMLHMITKSGMPPVHIRNEDETRPANAADLRRLIERQNEAPEQAARLAERRDELGTALFIGTKYQSVDPDSWQLSPRYGSQTFLKTVLIPTEMSQVEMDQSHEEKLLRLIRQIYPRTFYAEDIGLTAEERGIDYYQYAWYHKGLEYEQRWRITSAGETGHVTQMDYSGSWSIVDLAIYVSLFITFSLEWWKSIGHWGSGRIYACLNVPGLKLSRSPEGWYNSLFDPTYCGRPRLSRKDIGKDAVTLTSSPRETAYAEGALSNFADQARLARITSGLMNQLLRSLGHAVSGPLLEQSVRSIFS